MKSSLARQRRELAFDLVEQPHHLDWLAGKLELSRFNLGDVEQFVDEPREPIDIFIAQLQGISLVVRQWPQHSFADHPQRRLNGSQRRAKLVRYHIDEVRLELFQPFEVRN